MYSNACGKANSAEGQQGDRKCIRRKTKNLKPQLWWFLLWSSDSKRVWKKKYWKASIISWNIRKKINTLKWDFLPSTLQKLWLLRQTKCYYLAIWNHTSQESVKWYGVTSNDAKREVLCSQIVYRLYNNNNVKAKKKCRSTKLKLRIMVKDNRWSCTVQ